MAAPAFLPVRATQNYSMVEFEPFDKQRAADAPIDFAASLVLSSCDFVGVEGFEIGA